MAQAGGGQFYDIATPEQISDHIESEVGETLEIVARNSALMERLLPTHLVMAAYQQRLGEQLGIEPGAEMRTAIEQAARHDLPVLLIDREIGITLNRTARGLSWWRRAALFSGLVGSLISREDVSEEDIEHLKEGDVVETTFAEFAHDRGDLYEPLIAERDRYMAAKLRAVEGGALRVAATPAFGLDFLPTAVADYKAEHRETLFGIETLRHEELAAALLDSRIDIALAFDPENIPGIRGELLGQRTFV